MENDKLKAVILAAGKGTRLMTDGNILPKVMREALGKPLLRHVLNAIDFIPPEDCVIVVGYKKEMVENAFPGYNFATQEPQLGTGHAVMAAFTELQEFDGQLLVCYGDMPLIKKETYKALYETHITEGNACTMLSGSCEEDLPYGRIVRDEKGEFSAIVEDKDANEEQKKIKELNSGVYMFDAPALKAVLDDIKNDNSQSEYYLTDAPLLLMRRSLKVGICRRELGYEIIGVNTYEQLKQIEVLLKK